MHKLSMILSFQKGGFMQKTIYESTWGGQTDELYLVTTSSPCHPHLHKNIEIIYNLFETQQVVINNKAYKLHPNQLAISIAHDLHQYIQSDHTIHIILIIPDSYAQSFYSAINDKNIINNVVSDNNKKIFSLLDQLKEEKEKDVPNPIILEGLTKCILGNILEKLQLEDNVSPFKTKNFIQKVFNYIEENYKSPLTLETIANYFGYSKFYFSRLFNKVFSNSFNEYLALIRYSHTIKYLSEHDCTVTAAALENGFGSVKTFYKYCKKFNLPI